MGRKNEGEIHLPEFKPQNLDFNIKCDLWLCGPAESDSIGEKFPGAFPAGFLKRLKATFKKYYPTHTREILHVCSGRVPPNEGLRLDISATYNPDFLCDCQTFILPSGNKVPDNLVTWSISDTPYNKPAAHKYYSSTMIERKKVLRQMNRVTKIGGFIGILDQIIPTAPPKNLIMVAKIGVSSVPNLDLRIFSVLKKIGPTTEEVRAEGSQKMEEYF